MEMNLVRLIIFTVVSIGKGPRLTGKHGPDLVIIFPAEISLIRQDSVESLISSKHKRSVNDIMETLLGPFQINDPKLVTL